MTDGIREVEELPGRPPGVLVHPEWTERWPWLVQGITLSDGAGGGDFGLFGSSPACEVVGRWNTLARDLGVGGVVHARQVHGAAVRVHAQAWPGLHLAPPADGHLTRVPGLALAVSVADCVPVFLVDPDLRAVALIHAGWRGTAAGILEVAVRTFRDRLGSPGPRLHMHLGPAICGECYEVGPEVHAALGDPEPPGATLLDLRGNLVRRAQAGGLEPARITRSPLCTRCSEAPLYSHRGGDSQRQIGFLGVAR